MHLTGFTPAAADSREPQAIVRARIMLGADIGKRKRTVENRPMTVWKLLPPAQLHAGLPSITAGGGGAAPPTNIAQVVAIPA